jgi:hypothetical protein
MNALTLGSASRVAGGREVKAVSRQDTVHSLSNHLYRERHTQTGNARLLEKMSGLRAHHVARQQDHAANEGRVSTFHRAVEVRAAEPRHAAIA